MSKRTWMLAPQWLVAFVASSLLAPPAHAERWHDLKKVNRTASRIDLDSLKREGNLVTYRAEFIVTLPNLTKRYISTAVIDCENGKRKGIESEQFRADGSIYKGSTDMGWRTIQPDTISSEIRQFICSVGQ